MFKSLYDMQEVIKYPICHNFESSDILDFDKDILGKFNDYIDTKNKHLLIDAELDFINSVNSSRNALLIPKKKSYLIRVKELNEMKNIIETEKKWSLSEEVYKY